MRSRTVLELLTDPLYFDVKIEKNKMIDAFVKQGSATVQDFIKQHLSPYLLVRFYQHPFLRIQLLAYCMAASDKKAVIDILFTPYPSTQTVQQTIWLAAIAYIADGNRSILTLLQQAPYSQHLQTLIQRYPEDVNFYIAYASYESFFRTFRLINLDLDQLSTAATNNRIAIPDREPVLGNMTPQHCRDLPWVVLDVEHQHAMLVMCDAYKKFLIYYLQHLDELRIDYADNHIGLSWKLNQHFNPCKTSTKDLQDVFAYLEKVLIKMRNAGNAYQLSQYDASLLKHHGVVLLDKNTPYPTLRSFYISLIVDKNAFDGQSENNHLAASYLDFMKFVISQLKNGTENDLMDIMDKVNQQAKESLQEQRKEYQAALLFMNSFKERLLQDRQRYLYLIAYQVMNDATSDSAMVEDIRARVVSNTLFSLPAGVPEQARILHAVMDCLYRVNPQIGLNTIFEILSAPRSKCSIENITALVGQLEGYDGTHRLVPGWTQNGEYFKDIATFILSRELLVPLSIKPELKHLTAEKIQTLGVAQCHAINGLGNPYFELFEALLIRQSDQVDAARKLEALCDHNNTLISEQANTTMAEMYLLGEIGYDPATVPFACVQPSAENSEKLEKRSLQTNAFNIQQAIYALEYVCRLDLTKEIHLRLFQYTLYILGDIGRKLNAAHQDNIPLPVAKNIYHFYHQLVKTDPQKKLPEVLHGIMQDYVTKIEKKAGEINPIRRNSF